MDVKEQKLSEAERMSCCSWLTTAAHETDLSWLTNKKYTDLEMYL